MKARFFCENCGTEVRAGAATCPSCGRAFRAVRCPECGYEGGASEFSGGCPVCGFRVQQDKAGAGARSTPESAAPEKPRRGGVSPAFYRILGAVLLAAIAVLLAVLFLRP
jgi:uncharacterized membrane protein YvbJ